MDYVRPGVLWQDFPSTATPITEVWLNGVDDALEDLGGAAGRVKALEAADTTGQALVLQLIGL